jgi:hypothetical protein
LGAGRAKEPRGVLGALARDWNVNGILTLSDGRPFSITSTDRVGAGPGRISRANCSGDPVPSNFDQTIDHWFDTTAFSEPAALTYGQLHAELGGRSGIEVDEPVAVPVDPLGRAPHRAAGRVVQYVQLGKLRAPRPERVEPGNVRANLDDAGRPEGVAVRGEVLFLIPAALGVVALSTALRVGRPQAASRDVANDEVVNTIGPARADAGCRSDRARGRAAACVPDGDPRGAPVRRQVRHERRRRRRARAGRPHHRGGRPRIAIPAGAQVVDLGDATHPPGFIDAHTHVTDESSDDWNSDLVAGLRRTIPEATLRAAEFARRTLMAGFTTVRDVGAGDYIDVGCATRLPPASSSGRACSWPVHALGARGGHCDASGFPYERFRPGTRASPTVLPAVRISFVTRSASR